jgi:O-antigen/teichoic acid export membrane protein
MLAESTVAPVMSEASHRASFFRQSGWLMIANIAGGVLMWAVHLLNRYVAPGQYGSFGTFLAVVMVLPTIPLQMVLAQQTAKAVADHSERHLAGVVRFLWGLTTLAWLVGAVVVLAFQRALLARWHMTDPVGLWVTLPVVLLSLWMPMFWGVLQGQQNFLWLGWTMMSNGIGRIVVATVAVMVLGAGAAGMMAGVLLGLLTAIVLAAWQTRGLWLSPAATFDRLSVLKQILPLMLGFLGFQVLFTADTILVKGYFAPKTVDFYVSAGTMSRALMWLVLPLATVMFPKLIHSAHKGQKNNLLGLVMLGTAVLGVAGALGLSLLGPWVLGIIYKKTYIAVASKILPWYVSAMVPLGVANVLLNNLLARPASKLLPAGCVFLVSVGYVIALTQFHGNPGGNPVDGLVTVLKTMGVFNLIALAVCAGFTRFKAEVPG